MPSPPPNVRPGVLSSLQAFVDTDMALTQQILQTLQHRYPSAWAPGFDAKAAAFSASQDMAGLKQVRLEDLPGMLPKVGAASL